MADKSTDKTKKAAPAGNGAAQNRPMLMLGAVALALAVAAGVYYVRGGFDHATGPVAEKDKTDPSSAALLAPGPLPEMTLGKEDAPNVIVEYASMTCPHCAQFQTQVFPQVKTKYIDTGKVRYIFREFPLDGLAVAASMLARCSGDKYFPMIDALFQTQPTWVVPGADGKDKLFQVARQAGISREEFDKCLADKDLFNKIVEVRKRGNEEFQVDSTPSFFVNGKRVKGEHNIEDFDLALGEKPTPKDDASKAAAPADAGSVSKPDGAAPPAQTSPAAPSAPSGNAPAPTPPAQ
jgi:protein-disulfide isomerase